MKKMIKPSRFFTFLTIALWASLPAATVHAAPGGKKAEAQALTLTFSGVNYLHRWSKDGQNEFTPPQESDLSSWRDMVTINVHDAVATPEALAQLANRSLGFYQENGQVLRTDSRPATAARPAEHLAAAVLGNDKLLEANFTRFLLAGGTGISLVYSHRVYGKPAAAAAVMEQWLSAQGDRMEKALMAWDKIPPASVLKRLPQSGAR